VKAKSSQVPNMFSKKFPIAPHFYPICSCKCCPPLGQRKRTLYFELLFWGVSLVSFFLFFSDGPIKFAHYHTQKRVGEIGRHLI